LDSACGVHILGHRSKLHATHFMVVRHHILGHRSKLHATHFMVVRHVLAYPGEASTMVCLPFFFSLSPALKNMLSLQKFRKVWSFVNFINFDPYSFQF
jgi:hypothetical protein